MTERELASRFAKENGLKVVSIPYLQNEYRACDEKFGDYAISDASPEMFLTLIRDAEVIITDSFHACAFSTIFKKQFFVCERVGGESMNSRIIDIVDLADCNERYLKNNDMMRSEYISKLKLINYSSPMFKLEKQKEISFRFFDRILDACEGNSFKQESFK